MAWPAPIMDDDDFDFSDADLDDLPANTLQQLETTAIRATQQQQNHHGHAVTQTEDSDYYGYDNGDEDEVVNLDDARGAPHFPNNNTQGYQATQRHNGSNTQYGGAMEVEQAAPRQSQVDVDVGKLLERIKKVGGNHRPGYISMADGCS